MAKPKRNPTVEKILTLAMYFSASAAIILTNIAASTPMFELGSKIFVYRNLSVAFIVATFVLGLFLRTLQGDIYALFSRTKDLDERQLDVRRKVYERAYVGIVIAAVIGTIFIDRGNTHSQGVATWLLISAVFNLPSMLAAFHKNS